MSASLIPTPVMQFFDSNGNPLSGGKVYTYAAGTSTPLATYTDQGGATPNANPVILDSRGEAAIWFGVSSTSSYKIVLKTSADVLIWTADNVTASLASLAASSGSSLIGFLQAGTGAVARTVQAKERDIISVKDFGAVGDGVTNDTSAVQAAITYAAPLGKSIYLPAGTYKVTSTLIKAQSNYGLNMYGDGAALTRISYTTGAAGTPAIRVVGGSGYLCNASIEGIGFDGNASNTWGIEIQGQCGQRAYRCEFGTNLRGMVFHNSAASSFTEYSTATDCDFMSTCVTAVEYKITSGNDSFNGSGFAGNCTVVTGGTGAVVIVGAGCLPYNAPLSLQCWNTAAATLIQNLNTTALNCSWYGDIRLESIGAGTLTLATNANSLTRTFFTGHVISLTEYWEHGTLIIGSQFTSTSGGDGNTTLQPLTVRTTGVVTGGTVTFNPAYALGGTNGLIANSYLLHINLLAANYHYTHICVVTYAGGQGGSDAITILATQQAFNVTGWGASTFSINGSGQLVITNASVGFSVTAVVGVTPIGANSWN